MFDSGLANFLIIESLSATYVSTDQFGVFLSDLALQTKQGPLYNTHPDGVAHYSWKPRFVIRFWSCRRCSSLHIAQVRTCSSADLKKRDAQPDQNQQVVQVGVEDQGFERFPRIHAFFVE